MLPCRQNGGGRMLNLVSKMFMFTYLLSFGPSTTHHNPFKLDLSTLSVVTASLNWISLCTHFLCQLRRKFPMKFHLDLFTFLTNHQCRRWRWHWDAVFPSLCLLIVRNKVKLNASFIIDVFLGFVILSSIYWHGIFI